MATIDHQKELNRAGADVEGWFDGTIHLAKRYPLGAIGAIFVFVFVMSAVFADVVAPHDPLQTDATRSLSAPDASMIFGADMMGRDVLSRIIHGARISLAVGIGSTILGGIIGVVVGLMSGYLLG